MKANARRIEVHEIVHVVPAPRSSYWCRVSRDDAGTAAIWVEELHFMACVRSREVVQHHISGPWKEIAAEANDAQSPYGEMLVPMINQGCGGLEPSSEVDFIFSVQERLRRRVLEELFLEGSLRRDEPFSIDGPESIRHLLGDPDAA